MLHLVVERQYVSLGQPVGQIDDVAIEARQLDFRGQAREREPGE